MRVIDDTIREDYHLPNDLVCPYCNAKQNGALDGVAGQFSRMPTADDYAICVDCAEVSIYILKGDILALRKLMPADKESAIQQGIWDGILIGQSYIRNTDHGLNSI